MIRIKVCSQCGDIYELDDVDEDLGVCENCNPYDEDMIGIIDFSEWTDD